MNTITILGLTIILLYSSTQIMKFYGIGEDVYGVYVLYFIFIMISIIVLPNDYPKV
jgi:hypothetical protein